MKFNKRVLGPVSFYRRDGIQYRPTTKKKKTFLFAGDKNESARAESRGLADLFVVAVCLAKEFIRYTVKCFIRRSFATENTVLL